jgi:hypothetical protein
MPPELLADDRERTEENDAITPTLIRLLRRGGTGGERERRDRERGDHRCEIS